MYFEIKILIPHFKLKCIYDREIKYFYRENDDIIFSETTIWLPNHWSVKIDTVETLTKDKQYQERNSSFVQWKVIWMWKINSYNFVNIFLLSGMIIWYYHNRHQYEVVEIV